MALGVQVQRGGTTPVIQCPVRGTSFVVDFDLVTAVVLQFLEEIADVALAGSGLLGQALQFGDDMTVTQMGEALAQHGLMLYW